MIDISRGPESLVGRWIRAGALERIETRNQIRQSIMDSGGFTAARAEVVFRTFAAAVERWWPSDSLADEHPAINAFIDYYEGHEQFQFIEVETLVRAARGEVTSADEIAPKRRFLINHLLFQFACIRNELSQHAIDEIIVEGEQNALAAGFAIRTAAELQ